MIAGSAHSDRVALRPRGPERPLLTLALALLLGACGGPGAGGTDAGTASGGNVPGGDAGPGAAADVLAAPEVGPGAGEAGIPDGAAVDGHTTADTAAGAIPDTLAAGPGDGGAVDQGKSPDTIPVDAPPNAGPIDGAPSPDQAAPSPDVAKVDTPPVVPDGSRPEPDARVGEAARARGALVGGGVLMKGARFRAIVTLGQMPGGAVVSRSAKYQVRGGVVGATQSR